MVKKRPASDACNTSCDKLAPLKVDILVFRGTGSGRPLCLSKASVMMFDVRWKQVDLLDTHVSARLCMFGRPRACWLFVVDPAADWSKE